MVQVFIALIVIAFLSLFALMSMPMMREVEPNTPEKPITSPPKLID